MQKIMNYMARFAVRLSIFDSIPYFKPENL